MKKIISFAFLLICLFCISCNGVSLKDFKEKETVNADLGSIYEINESKYYDTKGNAYYTNVSVKDSTGKKVAVIAGEFEVSDLAGYTIEVTVKVTDKKTLTRIVTVNVVDNDGPDIEIDKANIGFVGSMYELPVSFVTDLSGEVESIEYNLYYEVGGERTPITYTNDCFTPTQAGSYIYEIKASDEAGNESVVSKIIPIRDNPLPGVIESFDDELSLLVFNESDDVEWYDTFAGRTGVAHVCGVDASMNFFFFKLLNDREFYKFTPFTSIIVEFQVAKYADLYQASTDGDIESWLGAEAGKWITWEITMFDFQTLFAEGLSSSGAQFFWTWTKGTDLYIDKISYKAPGTMNFDTLDDKYEINKEITFNASVENASNVGVVYEVTNPNGDKQFIETNKFTPTMKGTYTVKAIPNQNDYAFLDASATQTFEAVSNNLTTVTYPDEIDMSNTAQIKKVSYVNGITGLDVQGVTVTSKLYRKGTLVHTFDNVNTVDYQFTESGTYSLVYEATDGTNVLETATYTLYVVDYTYKTGELSNFAGKNILDRIRGTNKEMVYEYLGYEGLVKVNLAANASVNLKMENKITLNDFDYIEINFIISKVVKVTINGTNYGYQSRNKLHTIRINKTDLTNASTFISTTSSHSILTVDGACDVYLESITYGLFDQDILNHTISFYNETLMKEQTSGSYSWVSSYEGATGLAYKDSNVFYFNLGLTETEFNNLDWDYIAVKYYLVCTPNGNYGNTAQLYDGHGWRERLPVGEWAEARIYKSNGITYNQVNGKSELFEFCDASSITCYFDYVDFKKFSGENVKVREFNFASELTTASLVDSNGTATKGSYLAEYEGATGVAKFACASGSTYNGVQIRLLANQSDVDAITATKLVVRVYVDGTGTRTGSETLGQVYYTSPVTGSNYGANFELNKWVEIELDLSRIKDLNHLKGNTKLFSVLNATVNNIYIDYICYK